MAKKLVYNSTFTPGAAGAGTIAITGNYPLKVFQLVTNVTDGIIIFNFADPANGGTISYNGGGSITVNGNKIKCGNYYEHGTGWAFEQPNDIILYIKPSDPSNMTDLLDKSDKIGIYDIGNKWVDIGHIEDFKKANVRIKKW